MSKRACFRRSLLAIAVVAAGAAVYGCGGGDARDATPANVVEVGEDVRSAVLVTGRGTGFAAQALRAGLKAGSKNAFDVLVIDADVDADTVALAEAAIEQGKRVVVDGSGGADAALARQLAGMSVEADAVMVMKASEGQDGYVVVPIDNEASAARRKAALQAANPTAAAEELPVNTVQSVFGL